MKKILTSMLMLAAFAVTGTAQDTWTVAGTAAALNGTADWAPSNTENDMTFDGEENVWKLTVQNCALEKGVTYQYKVVKNHAWDEAYPSSNKTFSVTETAIYTVVYTFNANTKDVSEETSKTGEAGEITHTYTVAGNNVDLFGSSWDPSNAANDMTLDEGLYKLSLTNKHLVGKYEFKVCLDHGWGTAFPNNNYEFTIDADKEGEYNVVITFNADSKDITVTTTLLQLSRTMKVGASGWGTWHITDNLDFSAAEIKAYTAEYKDSKVVLTEVGEIPAGTCVVLKGTADQKCYVPVIESTEVTNQGDLRWYDNYDVASDTEHNVYALTYDGTNAKFALVAMANLSNGHVLLVIEKSALSRESLDVVFADETTGISSVNAEANNGVYYNLQGIRVAQPTKGLYIVNGKKMLVK